MIVRVILANLEALVLNVLIYRYTIKKITITYQQYFNKSSVMLQLMGKLNSCSYFNWIIWIVESF